MQIFRSCFPKPRAGYLSGKSLYDSLFPNGNGIGKYIEVKGSPFKVIGVFESTEQSGLTAGADRVAYIPLQQWHRLFEELNVNPEVTVQTYKADDLKKVAKKLEIISINKSLVLIICLGC